MLHCRVLYVCIKNKFDPKTFRVINHVELCDNDKFVKLTIFVLLVIIFTVTLRDIQLK